MSCLIWAQELQTAIKKSASVVDKLAVEKEEEAQETRQRLQIITQQLRSTLRSVWMADDNVFEVK